MEMFFLPGTFLGGCYGMNWENEKGRSAFIFLGLDHWYSYPAWWLLVITIAMCMYFHFKHHRMF